MSFSRQEALTMLNSGSIFCQNNIIVSPQRANSPTPDLTLTVRALALEKRVLSDRGFRSGSVASQGPKHAVHHASSSGDFRQRVRLASI